MLNMTNVLLWFLQGTSGAVAGYITNKYAVNMLFKEYTPFRIGGKVILPYKFGGVIKNRKEKFIEELSDLVERDIINGNTIKSQFASDEFKKAVNKLSYDFLDESLQESFENLRISDISGFEKTMRRLSLKLFDAVRPEDVVLSESEKDMFDFILLSGKYGNMESRVIGVLGKDGGTFGDKIKYIFKRLSVPLSEKNPNYESMKVSYPVFYKHRILLPLLPLYRVWKALTTRRNLAFKELSEVIKRKR